MQISSSIVFNHPLDEALLEQIHTLRRYRLEMAERMLANVERTTTDLHEVLGEVENAFSVEEVRAELLARIHTLRCRMDQPEVVFADEIDLYADLIDDDLDIHH